MTKLSRILFPVIAVLLFFWIIVFIYLRNPVFAGNGKTSDLVSPETLKKHVFSLSSITPSRSYDQPKSMFAAEVYIKSELEKLGYKVKLQEVYSEENVYHNIIARYGDEKAKEVIVIGAHYDTCEKDNPGADDNGSGVAGLIEIAKLFVQQKPSVNVPVEFVAYTLEEPPYFGGKSMGSAYHAEELYNKKISVKYMLSLEMLGYFSDSLFSQSYPFGFFYTMYPWTGNFVVLVSAPADRDLTATFKRALISGVKTNVYSVNAPAALPGIDFSDHRSYWAYEWPAIMITDTAFLRNEQYHQAGDTYDRLDYARMADVVGGIYGAIIKLESITKDQ